MDARERLRLYLEQRRELGESELILDGMSIDEVMALLGARETARPPRGTRSTVSAMIPPDPRPPAAPPAASPPATSPPAAAPVPPPEPARRFASSASGDWREALRQADAGSGGGAPLADRGTAASVPRPAELPDWLAALDLSAGLAASGADLLDRTASGVGLEGLAEATNLETIADLVRRCTRCGLHASARQAVPGEGNPQAELVCVGEAPGANEDELGRPFVGEAGQLLTKILAAIDLPRESVFICNVLKHRPPANRDPLPEEVAACRPFLQRQLLAVRPRVILALGRFAAQTLLGTTATLGKLREQIHLYHGIPVIVTYHPAALLRNDAWKRPTWNDVKLARRILDASRAAGVRTGDQAP